MTILVDYSNIMISTLMAQLGRHTNAQIEEGMLRHMTLNTIRANNKKFSNDYGDLVLCFDDKNYWRRQVFPYYKAARRKAREASDLDWGSIFETLNKIKQELKDYFPYKVIQSEHAEADDVIGVICHEYGQQLAAGERILILSSDKDMTQLQKFANVDQYDPIRKRWLRNSNPEENLLEHILKGDSGDGIPNVLSNDDTFVTKARQKPLTKKRKDEIINSINNLDEETNRNYHRNRMLIDLSNTPDSIREDVLKQFNTDKGIGREKLFSYFVENRLRNLITDIGDF